MKKLISCLCIMFVCVFAMVGCGVAGSDTLVSIEFSKPVFYVDENCPTKLEYKVYPSTAKNYDVVYTTSSQTIGELTGGIITVDEIFSSVKINIQSGNKTDSCYVLRKIYPSVETGSLNKPLSIAHPSLDNGEMVLTKDAETSLGIYATFSQEWQYDAVNETYNLASISETTKLLDYSIYKIRVTSSDPSVVYVPDASRPGICGVGRGSAEVTVELVNDNGVAQNISASITVEVVNPVDEIRFYDVSEGAFISPTTNRITNKTGTKTYYVFLFDKDGVAIDSVGALKGVGISIISEENRLSVEGDKAVNEDLLGDLTGLSFQITYDAIPGSADKIIVYCDYLLTSAGKQLYRVIGF
ncbi:MAG: hypothetical protein IJS68_00495 [Clostridia bacterium]|nr:hypothetical protein [Clostridia bacterium]